MITHPALRACNSVFKLQIVLRPPSTVRGTLCTSTGEVTPMVAVGLVLADPVVELVAMGVLVGWPGAVVGTGVPADTGVLVGWPGAVVGAGVPVDAGVLVGWPGAVVGTAVLVDVGVDTVVGVVLGTGVPVEVFVGLLLGTGVLVEVFVEVAEGVAVGVGCA